MNAKTKTLVGGLVLATGLNLGPAFAQTDTVATDATSPEVPTTMPGPMGMTGAPSMMRGMGPGYGKGSLAAGEYMHRGQSMAPKAAMPYPGMAYGQVPGYPGGAMMGNPMQGAGAMGRSLPQGMPMMDPGIQGRPDMMQGMNPGYPQGMGMQQGPGMMRDSGTGPGNMPMMARMRQMMMQRHQQIVDRLDRIEARLNRLEGADSAR